MRQNILKGPRNDWHKGQGGQVRQGNRAYARSEVGYRRRPSHQDSKQVIKRVKIVMIHNPFGYDVKAERVVNHHYLYPPDKTSSLAEGPSPLYLQAG